MRGSAIVKSISRRSDASYLMSVEVANESGSEIVEFILLDELFDSLDMEVGDEVSELLPTLDSYSDITAAFASACSSFAYVQASIKALYRKLISKGFSKETSREAIEIVRSRGFVDEQNIALRRAELMTEKLWGRSRILRKLFEEGFPEDVILNVSETLSEVDFARNCARVIEKKYSYLPEDRREREKMYASLSRLGYSSADIRKAMSLLKESE